MPDTAKTLGIDPWDMEQNIKGATRLTADLLKSAKGDPFLAEIGYNSSPRNIWAQTPLPQETYYHLQKVFPGQRQSYLNSRLPGSVYQKLYPLMREGNR